MNYIYVHVFITAGLHK